MYRIQRHFSLSFSLDDDFNKTRHPSKLLKYRTNMKQ